MIFEEKFALPPNSLIEDKLRKLSNTAQKSGARVEQEAQAAKFEADESWKNDRGSSSNPAAVPSDFSCFNIPENRKFCGREDILAMMTAAAISPTGTAVPGISFLLHGLGGMGKSSVAVKYIYNHLDVYSPLVFWFAADTRQKLMTSVVKACTELGFFKPEDSGHEVSNVAKYWRNWADQNSK